MFFPNVVYDRSWLTRPRNTPEWEDYFSICQFCDCRTEFTVSLDSFICPLCHAENKVDALTDHRYLYKQAEQVAILVSC